MANKLIVKHNIYTLKLCAIETYIVGITNWQKTVSNPIYWFNKNKNGLYTCEISITQNTNTLWHK